MKEEIEHRGVDEDNDSYDRDSDRRAEEDRDGLALLKNFFRGPKGNKRANVFKKFIGILSDSEDLMMEEDYQRRKRDNDRDRYDRDRDRDRERYDNDRDRYDDDRRRDRDRYDDDRSSNRFN